MTKIINLNIFKSAALYRVVFSFAAMLALAGCGGGGGGGSPSYTNNSAGSTPSAVSGDGSASKPFTQASLAANGVTDPNGSVASSTTTYNLERGVADAGGAAFSSSFPATNSRMASNFNFAGVAVSGQGVVGPTFIRPSTDVLAAWNAGWTGKDKNILLIDGYASIGTCNNAKTCHGITTMMTANLVAPGAGLYGLDSSLYASTFAGRGISGSSGTTLSSPVNINVVNVSVSFANWGNCGGCGAAPTATSYANMIASTANSNAAYVNLLSGASAVQNLNNLSNAVITKAAGNDAIDAKYDVTTLALASNASVVSRLLVVGALNKNGSVASPASIASYSNVAGSLDSISKRFVLANGNSPYSSTGVAMNGSSIASSMGTSYAAPVVAGYAAIIMQKFPNLSAANTSNIILDTARTDTLVCYPNCPANIYGAGEASLSRALAPVGRLR